MLDFVEIFFVQYAWPVFPGMKLNLIDQILLLCDLVIFVTGTFWSLVFELPLISISVTIIIHILQCSFNLFVMTLC